MATTILSAFEKLKQNLEITGLQKETVSTRQTNVRDVISSKVNILNSFLTGSYCRSTMISPLSMADIDIFFVLDSKYFKADNPESVLATLQKPLAEKYTTTQSISKNGQAITIKFSDFIVDAVPSFNRKDGGFLIPDTKNKKWISTDPKKHEEYISKQNSSHEQKLIPLIKMMKGINRQHGSFLTSFYLELLVADILTNITISNYPSGVRYTLVEMIEKVKYTQKDPSGLGGHVQGLTGLNPTQTSEKVKSLSVIAQNAEAFEKNGKTRESVQEWKKLFGDFFPAYE